MTIRSLVHKLLVPLLLLAGTATAHAQDSAGVRDRGFEDAAQAATQVPRGTLYILTVGVGSYTSGVEQLNYTLNDARAFADTLLKGASELFDRVVIVDTLYDGRATATAIRDAIRTVAAEAGSSDTFVFFYAGHGTVARKDTASVEQFFLAPVNVTSLTEWSSLIRTGIAHWELAGLLTQVNAGAKLVVLDACQSGAFIKHASRDGLTQYGLQQVGERSGTAILAATGPSRAAYELDGIKHGLFTRALLESLAPSTPPKDRTIASIAYETRVAIGQLARRLSVNQRPWDTVPSEIAEVSIARR